MIKLLSTLHSPTKMKTETYFRIVLTEPEHEQAWNLIESFCFQHGLEFVFYRKIKVGVNSNTREVKVKGKKLDQFKQFLKEQKLDRAITYAEDSTL